MTDNAKSKPKTNWEQIIEQDPSLAKAETERSSTMVLKANELELRLAYHEYQGYFRYDLRMWAFIDGQWRPTKRGLVIFPDQIEEFVRRLLDVISD